MRVIVLVKATIDSEAGKLPSTDMLMAMGKFNAELVAAGIMLSVDGLYPSSEGKRVTSDGSTRAVADGPFEPAGELVAGFWLWQVNDMNEAVEWVKRCPAPLHSRSEIEIRPIIEVADFGAAVARQLSKQVD